MSTKMPPKPTIYQIKAAVSAAEPFYFDRKSLRLFGQRLSDYSVNRTDRAGVFEISCPYLLRGATVRGLSQRFYAVGFPHLYLTFGSACEALDTGRDPYERS